jgi:rhodanese-related sulfurtransferase
MELTKTATKSLVLATPAASNEAAQEFFQRKLGFETDPSDVYTDMKHGAADFVLMDVRSPSAYVRSHAVGAINMPHGKINAESMAEFSKDKLIVVYCWGPGCNGATKAAIKLSSLGFPVKEMIGGIEYWEDRDRYPVERGQNL